MENLAFILSEAVMEFTVTHTQKQKHAIVKADAKNNDIAFENFAACEIYTAMQSILTKPYATLTKAQKNRFVYFVGRMNFESLADWANENFFEAKDSIFDIVSIALDTDREYFWLKLTYNKK